MAFGGFTFGQTNQNQQQQQQQQNPAPTFGGFGSSTSTPVFGSSAPAFGAQQPQQQTSLFGSAGGGFGANSSTTPAFGSTSANTGGGLFGGASQTSTGGGFGSATTGGGFSFGAQPGQQQQSTGLFGSAPTSTFGSQIGSNANPNDPAQPNPNCPIPTNGTADAPAHPKDATRVLMWKDNRNPNQPGLDGKPHNITGEQLFFDNITALPQYWHVSPEELRVQDYQQGRKTAPAAPASTFGGFGQSNTGSTFGGFGQQQQQQPGATTGGGLFGQPSSTGTTGGGLFGGAGSAFGKPATPAPAFGSTGATGGGLFGQPAASTSTPAFGSANTSTTGGFGGFGAAANQPKPAFSFGGANTSSTQPTGGLFGQQQPQQSTGFGATPQQGQTQPTSTFGGFGSNTGGSTLFGGAAAKPPGSSLFGQPSTGADANKPSFSFGQQSSTTQPSGGLFGQQQPQGNQQQQQQQQPQQSGGLFGNLGGTGQTSAFGQQPSATTSTLGGGGLFGNAANKPATGGLFGQPSTTQPSLQLGQSNTTGGTGGGLFGGGGGLFGQQQNQQQNQQQQPQQQPQQSSLFGQSTGGGGLFGNLGGGAQQSTQPTSSFSLTQPSSFGGFGQSQNALTQTQQQQQQQQPLQPIQASIDQNPYGNNPIFANVQPLPSGPKAVDATAADSAKKQPALALSYRGTPRSVNKIAKLRGFASSASSSALATSRFGSPALPGTPLGNGISRAGSASPSVGGYNLANGLNDALTLSPQAFVSRPSVKKLVIDNKNRQDSDLLFGGGRSKTAPPATNNDSGRLTFNPNAETADRTNGSVSRVRATASPASSATLDAAPSNGVSSARSVTANVERTPDDSAFNDGDYYTIPSIKVLQSMSKDDLSEVHDLVVRRVGYGQVRWLEPVDLTGLPSVKELLGGVVVIEDREIMVYSGEYEEDKPEVGGGLNVPAAVSLKNCWPLDKASRQPIKDANNPRVNQHIKKLQKKAETEFVDYEVESGTWTFKVAHFSRYGLDSSDGEDEDDEPTPAEHSSPAVQRKRALQERTSRLAKQASRADSPTSDTEQESDETMNEAPPRLTLEDESMTEATEEDEDDYHERSRTPIAPRFSGLGGTDTDGDMTYDEDGEPIRRRERSVVVPTPRFSTKAKLWGVESSTNQMLSSRQATPSETVSRAMSEANMQRPIAHRLGLEPKKLALMQASFFSGGASKASQEVVPAVPRTRTPLPPFHKPAEITERATSAIMAPLAPHSDLHQQEQMMVPEEVFSPVYKPLRKWKTIPLADSLASKQEAQYVDAGLAMARSFRASFGPQGQLVHLGRLARLSTGDGSPSPLNVVKITQPATLAVDASEAQSRATTLLDVQLAFTEINADSSDEVPQAVSMPHLRFRNISSAFDSKDTSHEANLWRLGQALFDEIDLRLPANATNDLTARVALIRRRDAFSAWLKKAVAPAVEDDLRRLTTTGASTSSTPAATVFALLTGAQVERACQAAAANGDIRLATLLAQVGGDDEFRSDVDLQLAKWREYRVDPHIGRDYRKIYELLSGNVDVSRGMQGHGAVDTSQDIKICDGLDWKRAFGLRFWYAQFDTSLPHALRSYDGAVSADSELAKPLPAHEVAKEATRWELPDSGDVKDGLYELIRLFSDSTLPLESVLTPRAYTTSPFDYRQSWHLYQTLSRSMRVRDLSDADTEGQSAKAEELTMNYASQLERIGLWQWATFVCLHLDSFESREKAVRELLARHIGELDDDIHTFLVEQLKIPASLIKSVQETYGEEEEDPDRE